MTAIASPSSNISPVPGSSSERRQFANTLRQQTIACRIHHEKLGVRRALTREQIRKMANEFSADSNQLTAAKRILDTSDPAYRTVISIRQRSTHFWKSMSVPYPEPGVRLIRKDRIDAFTQRMTEFAAELNTAVKVLQERYKELRDRARDKLGDLFSEDDYPTRIDGEFSLDWDFPSIEPPAYLKDLHPHLYEQEVERIRGRFEEAVRLTEQVFTAKFAELIAHLAERLKGDVDGKPKTFKNASIENLKAFFEEFKSLDVGSSGELQQLIGQAQKAVEGVNPDELRGNDAIRNQIGAELSKIQEQIDGLMIAKPKRAIDLGGGEE